MSYKDKDNDKPLISIGMPVFNGENYIVGAIDSLLSQTLLDFELIISDNASIDRTGEICEEYATKHRQIKYFCNKENIGATRNFNKVFNLATGKYFKWAASDDVCDSRFLQKCVDILDQDESTILCYPKEIAIDEKGKVIAGYMDKYDKLFHLSSSDPVKRFKDIICKRHACYLIFGLIRRSSLLQTSLMGSYVGTDRVLLAQLVLAGCFERVDVPIYFRRHGEQYCALKTDESRKAWIDPKCFECKTGGTLFNCLLEYAKLNDSNSLTIKDKMRCYLLLTEWMIKKRKRLFNEIISSARNRCDR